MTGKSWKFSFFAVVLTAAASLAIPTVSAQAGPPPKMLTGASKAAGKAIVEGVGALGKRKIIEETIPNGVKDGKNWTVEHMREWGERGHDLLKGLDWSPNQQDDDNRKDDPSRQ